MEQLWNKAPSPLTVQDLPQEAVETACFHALDLIQRNCEYLDQHFAHIRPDPETVQAINDISACAAKLDRAFGEILAFLDFLHTDESVQLQTLDLCALLRQIAAQADMIRAQLGVELVLDYGEQTACLVRADRNDAELLILHLLSNALRACAQGGQILLQLRPCADGWELIVQDNGCGLPGSDLQAPLDNRRSFLGGTQLGLVLCRECCRRMGWKLCLQPAAGQGTRAVVAIPAAAPDHSGADNAVLRSGIEGIDQPYRLRAMLVKELRTMPELGDPDEFP